MIRKSLIITNPGEIDEENYCNGVNVDVENYKSFLMSPMGGLWQDKEIKVLRQPNKLSLIMEMQSLNHADYSLVIFCGHGYYSEKKKSTIIELRPNTELDSTQLRQGASKHTLILDCCRTIAQDTEINVKLENYAILQEGIINHFDYRKHYDNQISLCNSGIVVLNACSIGESAGDIEKKGGYYSFSLLDKAQSWGNTYRKTTNNYEILSIVTAHELSIDKVLTLSGQTQNPTIEKPRTKIHFPFCIRG